jgi:hypothetical protein
MVPQLALAAEPAQLDHREREIQTTTLCLLHDFAVKREARRVFVATLWRSAKRCSRSVQSADFHGHLRAITDKTHAIVSAMSPGSARGPTSLIFSG